MRPSHRSPRAQTSGRLRVGAGAALQAMPTGTRRRPGDPRGGRYLKYRPPRVLIGRPMDSVRPRSAHRKRRLFLFLARPGSSMGGLHRPRVRRGKSIRAGPLLSRPAVPRRGLLVLQPVYCVQERGRKVLVEIPLPRRSLLPLAIRLYTFFFPASSVLAGHVRMVPSAEFRFSFSHARPVDCRPCRRLVSLVSTRDYCTSTFPPSWRAAALRKIAIWPITGTHAGGQPLAPM